MNSAEKALINCIRYACGCADDLPEIPQEDCAEVFKLARRQKVSSLVYAALNKCAEGCRKLTESEEQLKAALTKRYFAEVCIDTCQMVAIDRIRALFEKENVQFLPVKGTVLKSDYPFPNYRPMNDIDICIRPEDRGKVCELLKRLGAEETDRDGNDPNFRMTDGIRIETHSGLFYKRTANGIIEYSGMDEVDLRSAEDKEFAYAMNLYGHAIKHLAKGGIGIRFVLDLWMYRHRHDPQPDWKRVMRQMKEDGVAGVTENLIRLGECWFGDECPDEQNGAIAELAEYCFSGGVYGSKNAAVSTNDAALAGGRAKAVGYRLFLTKEEFQKRYPWAKKHPVLLPAAFCARLINTMTINRKAAVKWSKELSEIDDEKMKETVERLKRFGFE